MSVKSTVVNRLWILFTLFQGSKRSLEKWTNDSIKTMLAKNTTQRKCEYHYLQSSRRIIDPSNSLQSQHFPAEFSGVNILILDTLQLIPIFCCHSQEVLAVRAISSDSILDHWNQTRKTNGTDMKQWHTHKHTKVPSTSSTKTCIHNNMSGNVRRKLLPEFNKTKESEIERFLLDGFWLYIWMSWIVSPNSKNSKKQTTLPKTNLAPEKGHTGKTHGHTGKITINVHLKLHSLLWVIPYRILATNHHLPWCGC